MYFISSELKDQSAINIKVIEIFYVLFPTKSSNVGILYVQLILIQTNHILNAHSLMWLVAIILDCAGLD